MLPLNGPPEYLPFCNRTVLTAFHIHFISLTIFNFFGVFKGITFNVPSVLELASYVLWQNRLNSDVLQGYKDRERLFIVSDQPVIPVFSRAFQLVS